MFQLKTERDVPINGMKEVGTGIVQNALNSVMKIRLGD